MNQGLHSVNPLSVNPLHCAFLGEVKTFLISGRIALWGWGTYFLRQFSHFEMQDFKFQKYFAEAPSFLIFTVSDLRQVQNFKQILTLTLNLNSLFHRAVSFHPSVGTQNQPNPWNCCLFFCLMGLEGPTNHPISKARAFRMNVNMAATSKNQKWSFYKETTWGTTGRRELTCCLWLISLYNRQYFIKKTCSVFYFCINMFHLVLFKDIDTSEGHI